MALVLPPSHLRQSRSVASAWIRALSLCLMALCAGGRDGWLEASQSNPALIQERLNRAGSNLFSGTTRADQAIPELKAILADDPRLPEAHLLLAVAYRMQGSADLIGEAKAELVQALALKPDLVPARVYLVQMYLDLGRAATAREVLSEGLVRSPHDPQLESLSAETERQLGHPDRAVELARQVLRRDGAFAQARYYLGLALLDAGKRDEAITELEQVVHAGPKVADANLALGAACLDAGRVDEALDVLRQGTTIDPARPDLRIRLARAYRMKGLLDTADAQLALARPKPASTTAPQFLRQQAGPDFYLELGLLRRRQGRLQAAADAFRKALDIQSDREEAARELAEVRTLLQHRARKPSPPGDRP